MELAFNSCVDAVATLLSRRIALVRAMFGQDMLRQEWELERRDVQDARLRLLVERREMVGPQNGLDTSAQFYAREPDERGK